MAASATARDRDACLDACMEDCISKPLQTKQLEAALMRWLPQRAEPAAKIADDLLL